MYAISPALFAKPRKLAVLREQAYGTLHAICGKIASGKSTLSSDLAQAPNCILMSEDDLLAALFSAELKTIQDYAKYSKRVRDAITPVILRLLENGTSVVLDFSMNTVKQRKWVQDLVQSSKFDHVLHVLDVSDEECKQRLHKRNASGEHQFQVSDAQFDAFTQHFVAPSEVEGFNIERHAS